MKFFFFIFAVTGILTASAQEIKVVSAVDQAALPYVTITDYTHPLVIFSDENGTANLTAFSGDTCIVSYVGYNAARFIFDNGKTARVALTRDEHILSSVITRDCAETETFIYKNFGDKEINSPDSGNRISFGGVEFSSGSEAQGRFAVRVKTGQANARLRDFSFWLEPVPGAPKSAIKAPLLISFYNVSDSNPNIPGELAYDRPVFYTARKAGKQTVNLDSLRIRIPEAGIYVSFEPVRNKQFVWEDHTLWKDSINDPVGRDTLFYVYGGIIKGMYGKDFSLAFYNSFSNSWFMAKEHSPAENKRHGTIKLEAVIKYCKE